MAKRSDFAQKLLDDIRLRKEKLGYAASSGQPPSAEHQGNHRRSSRGTEAIKNCSSKNLVSTEVTEIWFTTIHNKTAAPKVGSRKIVPIGRATNSPNSVDASMALAFALSNCGKLHYTPKFGNELIPHSGSISYRESHNQYLLYNTRHHADRYPFLTNAQISEISKGVQKLNKILETCSDTSNYGKDSIQIGRELLKGATNLDDSLKMLVTLQEGSDCMVSSQGRQARLLKGMEEDESSNDEVNKNTLMYKPRISFDGSTKHFAELAKASDDTIIQRQRYLTSSYIGSSMTNSNYKEISLDASIKFTTHRRSLSCGPGSMPDSPYSGIRHKHDHGDELGNFSITNGKSSTSKSIRQLDPRSPINGSVRMPNVVAKLMGLEELPTLKAEVKKVKGKKDKSEKEMPIGQEADAKARKQVISPQRHFMQNYGRNKILNEINIEETKAKSSKEKTNYMRNMTPLSNNAPKIHLEISRKTENIDISHSLKEEIAENNLVKLMERVDKREKRSRSESATQDIIQPHQERDQQRTKEKSSQCHYNAASSKDTLLNKKDEQDRLGLANNQTKTQLTQQKTTVHMVKPKYPFCEKKDHDVDSKLKVSIATKSDWKSRISTDKLSTNKVLSGGTVVAREGSSVKVGNLEQPKERPKSSHPEMQNTMYITSDHMELGRIAYENSDDMKSLLTDPRTDKEKPVPQILVTALMKPVHIPTAKKVDRANMKVHRGESHKVQGDNSRYIKRPNEKNQQSSFLNDLERRWKERISKDKRATVCSHETNSEQHIDQETKSTLLSDDSLVDAGKDEAKEERSVAETNYDDNHKTAFKDSQEKEVPLGADSELRPFNSKEKHNLEKKQTEGATEDRQLNNCNLLKSQNQAISETNGQGSLTEDEYILMQLLINNQHFRNTAQVLFKIMIPNDVIQTSSQAGLKEENKPLLDCGYELLRRKGKREMIHAMTKSHARGKVRYLNALMKELNEDIESLKFPSETINNDSTAELLHMMLKRDIEDRKPDINCMWDIGWNNIIFASVEKDEIIRDMEKHVLSGLISELARELVNATITVS
ncbi:unnamed protein product [Musa acuminata var. zebrina]